MTIQNARSLQTFSRGQLAAAALGAVAMLALQSTLPGVPILVSLILCIMAAVGAAAALLLINYQKPDVAAYVFVASGFLSVILTLVLAGANSGAEFIWPILVATTLLGRRVGLITATICIAALLVAVFVEGSLYPILLPEVSARYIGILTMVISLALAVVVALVAGDNIQAALKDAQMKAHRLEIAYDQLAQSVAREREAKDEAEELAEGLIETSQRQHTNAVDAASAITQISSQVQELSSAAHQIAQSARRVLDAGQETKDLMADARARLEDDRKQLDEAVTAGEGMLLSASEVGKAMYETNRLLEIVADVTHESHILALNATIEAAQAGELGRRFGVVADEFTELANRSRRATDEAAAIVDSMGQRVGQLMTHAEAALASVRSSQQTSDATAHQTVIVEAAVNGVAEECMLIVSATEQQDRASTLIADAVEQVAGLSRGAATQSTQLGSYAERLSLQVARLTHVTMLANGV